MREKILQYLRLTGFDLDAIANELVEQIAGGLRREIADGLGAVPAEAEEAATLIEASLRSHGAIFLQRVLDACQQHFSEEDLDAIVAFYSTPTGKRLAEATPILFPVLIEAKKEWEQSALGAVEGQLQRLLGDAVPVTTKKPSATIQDVF